jgi:hypothetical protein
LGCHTEGSKGEALLVAGFLVEGGEEVIRKGGRRRMKNGDFELSFILN